MQCPYPLFTAEELTRLGPWGQGCPSPLFVNRFSVLQQRWLGGRHLKMVLQPAGARNAVDAIWFFCPLAEGDPVPETVTLAHELTVNEFRGQRSPQLLIRAEVPATVPLPDELGIG